MTWAILMGGLGNLPKGVKEKSSLIQCYPYTHRPADLGDVAHRDRPSPPSFSGGKHYPLPMNGFVVYSPYMALCTFVGNIGRSVTPVPNSKPKK